MKVSTKITLALVFILTSMLGGHKAWAIDSCYSKKVIGNNNFYWGSAPSQIVTAAKGDTIPVNIQGEDGCAGQTVRIEVWTNNDRNGQLIEGVSLVLDQGTPVDGKPGVLLFKSNWKIDVGNESYYFDIAKVGNVIVSSNGISNILTVRDNQACNISSVSEDPPTGLAPGKVVQFKIEAQGSCQGWKASLNVEDLSSGKSSDVVFAGSGQDVSSGKAIWAWTIPPFKSGKDQNWYKPSGNLGTQLYVSGSQFCVGNCQSGSGNCGGPGQPICSVDATAPKSYSFNITNPLAGSPNDLFGIIDVITKWIIYISIPLAVLFIMYAGFLMLTAGPVPANFQKGRDILKYVVLGLAIIFIGKGFVSLIISVIELGGTTATPTPTITGVPPPGSKSIGYSCKDKVDCQVSLTCGKNNICIFPSGNIAGQPCAQTTDCATDLTCDNSPANQQVIDGKTLGSCVKGAKLGQVGNTCAVDADCASSPTNILICKSTQCSRPSGNNLGEPCLSSGFCITGLICGGDQIDIDGRPHGQCVKP